MLKLSLNRFTLLGLLLLTLFTWSTYGQGLPSPVPCPQFFSAAGTPLAGGFLYSYQPGTTTPLATYTDATLGTANSNPIILNAGGYPVSSTGSCGVFINPQLAYKFVLQNSLGVQQWSVDNVNTLATLTSLGYLQFFPLSSDPGSPLAGMMDYNSTSNCFKGYVTSWSCFVTQATFTPSNPPLIVGSAGQAYPPGIGPVSPNMLETLSAQSSAYINNPDVYISRLDNTPGLLSCPTLNCGAPVARLDMQNTNTGSMSAQIGYLVEARGYVSTTPVGTGGGVAIPFSAVIADASSANNVNLTGANNVVQVNYVPTGLSNTGFTRVAEGFEADVYNNTSTAGQFELNSGSGNYILGASFNCLGTANCSAGVITSALAGAGNGWLDGFHSAGFVNNGYTTVNYNGTAATCGFCAGSGGIAISTGRRTFNTTGLNNSESIGDPNIGVLFDNVGIAANQNSATANFRGFAADTGHVNEWRQYYNNNLASLRWEYAANCVLNSANPCSSYTVEALLDSSGNFQVNNQLNFARGNFSTVGVVTVAAPTTQRNLYIPDGNSQTVMAASLVTTAAVSDNVTLQGVTASSHCSLTAGNASAATNIATTYISARAANQITVTHTATANMNYDVLCTFN